MLILNIPHNDGLQALQYFLQKSSFDLNITTITRLAELVLTLNSFSFAEDHYSQTKGVAMGTKMGPSYACLFVGYVEQQALQHYQGRAPSFYRRFIDDCLGVATGPETDLLDFINHMSTFHPALRFTHTLSPLSVTFLDLEISIQPGSHGLSTTVFYKETDSHSYLLYSSSHPPTTKNSIPYSQFLRLRRICSRDEDFINQAAKMVTFFLARGYPRHVVDGAVERARSVSRTDALTPKDRKEEGNDRTVAVLTFHPHNLPVRNILLHNFHVLQQDPELGSIFSQPPLVAFKRDSNIRDHLVRSRVRTSNADPSPPGNLQCNKPKCKTCSFIDPTTTFHGPSGRFTVKGSFNCQSSNVVYIITCSLCARLYVGETYRTLAERFSEHLRSMKLHYNNPIGEHFNSPGHNYTHSRVAAVWQNTSDKTQRQYMEGHIISRLGTLMPAGLNTRE